MAKRRRRERWFDDVTGVEDLIIVLMVVMIAMMIIAAMLYMALRF